MRTHLNKRKRGVVVPHQLCGCRCRRRHFLHWKWRMRIQLNTHPDSHTHTHTIYSPGGKFCRMKGTREVSWIEEKRWLEFLYKEFTSRAIALAHAHAWFDLPDLSSICRRARELVAACIITITCTRAERVESTQHVHREPYGFRWMGIGGQTQHMYGPQHHMISLHEPHTSARLPRLGPERGNQQRLATKTSASVALCTCVYISVYNSRVCIYIWHKVGWFTFSPTWRLAPGWGCNNILYQFDCLKC